MTPMLTEKNEPTVMLLTTTSIDPAMWLTTTFQGIKVDITLVELVFPPFVVIAILYWRKNNKKTHFSVCLR